MDYVNEKKISNGRWKHIIPPCILVYIVAFMDRTNISFAIAGGMDKSLGMTSTIAGLASGIFFVGYMILQIPGGNYAEKKSAKKFIGISLVAWAVLSITSGFVTSVWQLLILRFLLGVGEGGVWPAVLVIISHWFPNEERGRANGFFMMNFAIASIITGPISGWIISFSSWRWVFIIEGCLALLLILVWYPLISDRPQDAKWISEGEKDWILDSLKQEQLKIDSNIKHSNNKNSIYANPELWKLTLSYFCYQVGIYGFFLWLPTLIKQLTNSGIGIIGVLSVFPYIGTLFGIWIFSVLSDKTMKRKMFTAVPMLGLALALFLSVQFKSNIWISYGFLILCGFFLQGYNSSFWSMPPLIFSTSEAGGARGFINALGNLGGFIGPYFVGWLTVAVNSNVSIYFLTIAIIIGCLINSSIKLDEKII
ncbi:MAG: MFS transporter [Clostridium sp.]|jgi:MFS family permease|uniref:MFS transporter n=1 Tax=Clostridium sp. TaxID=1506 RepID=UPI0025C5A998|nr:MFS transporter [Clostridium sp.]MCH3963447.1 MFS transporter [Clostridium sp.]MCI1716685.1 MFS transporter [Clostridium sp.]MCI1801131.1 MFS transporter [Clostridium sp.]MCI1814871.1 MFS transporter [Clostridium sp.]MCI1871772.1 MFS transporter [Clostridium sp.]